MITVVVNATEKSVHECDGMTSSQKRSHRFSASSSGVSLCERSLDAFPLIPESKIHECDGMTSSQKRSHRFSASSSGVSLCERSLDAFPLIPESKRKSSRSSRMNETIAKEAADYWKCLDHPTKGRYIMLLEDDALVVPEFARLMTLLMDQLDRRQHIDYVKMYHPNQLRKIPSIPLFLADVRYYLTDTVYLSSPESCCTPAVLFRASKVAEMVSQLSFESRRSARTGHAKDHILDESRFVGRQTDMNLVVHIGAVSSVRKRRITLNEVIAVQARND
ncbi:hypothetical protein ANCCEY_13079 [Ancylostoma ceylanicum]|uniref:Uncharacterized protein n=1 Tax=Ancylostoma ceylanicum TaxID=53326 RepID=A0A0D6LDA6_9BILA|nr:hypothetical protein ANCCEY_13079 [Ancylostoma ceylanicum]